MNEIVLQVCNKCLEEKDVSLFKQKDRVICDACDSAYRKQYRDENKEKIAETKRKCYKAKPDHYKQMKRAYIKKNPEIRSKIQKKYAKTNRIDVSSKAYFRNSGFATNEIPAELLAAKIEQLKLIHLIKELQDEDRK